MRKRNLVFFEVLFHIENRIGRGMTGCGIMYRLKRKTDKSHRFKNVDTSVIQLGLVSILRLARERHRSFEEVFMEVLDHEYAHAFMPRRAWNRDSDEVLAILFGQAGRTARASTTEWVGDDGRPVISWILPPIPYSVKR